MNYVLLISQRLVGVSAEVTTPSYTFVCLPAFLLSDWKVDLQTNYSTGKNSLWHADTLVAVSAI